MSDKNLSNKKVAIICDWINDLGGAEQVLIQFLEIFPEADIFTSVFFQDKNPLFKGKKIYKSFIQKIPIINKSKLALMLRPLAFESFDLAAYDIIISSSSAESKGIITKPESIHFCYCHTPTRYFWSHYFEYKNMMEFGFFNFFARFLMPKIVHKLRLWDFLAAQRVDFFIANSKTTAKRISKYYKRKSEVIYPGIDISRFSLVTKKQDYYFYVGRVVPYKKFELIVDAFNQNGKNLIIATRTINKLSKKLIKKSNKNIKWVLNPDNKKVAELFENAKAFLFPPEEDFGIVPIEAMASGTPVIAYAKGGATETVIDNKTGIFFEKQTPKSLNKAIEKFEKLTFNYSEIRKYAEGFDNLNFKLKITNFIKSKK